MPKEKGEDESDEKMGKSASQENVRNRKKKDKEKEKDKEKDNDKEKENQKEKEKEKDKDKDKKDKEKGWKSKDKDEGEKSTIIENEVPQQKPAKKAPPRILCTREIGKKYLDRESYLKVCIREMIIFFIFLFVLGILATGHHSPSEYYLSRVMTKFFTETMFKTYLTNEIICYNDINTLEHVWEYFNFYQRNVIWLYWYSQNNKLKEIDKDEEKNSILYENKLMGRPRIRQLRVRNDSCTVPDDFQLMFSACYDEYSSSSEDKEEYGPSNANSTAWKYHSPKELGSLSVSGEISTYGGGGYYFDFEKDLDKTNQTVKELFDNLWLDRGSRAVIMQFTTYNVNENIFFTLTLLLELPPTGGVLPSFIIYMHKFIMRDMWDFILLGFIVVFVIFVIWYTLEEVFELLFFRWRYFTSFWNFLDFIILIFAYLTIGFFVYQYLATESQIKNLIKKDDEHASFDKINSARETFITLLAILFFFATIKVLKYMSFNHSMYQMQTTLSRATKDIACFSIIFFIVFITFAQLGHLLFGSQVKDFRSFVHSVFALLRTAVGDFDYHKIENVNHFLGPLYFFAYIFFIYFILVNMFLAIIIDTYSEVRNSIRDQRKELQMGDIFGRWFRGCLGCCGMQKLAAKHKQPMPLGAGEGSAYEDIQNLLRRCGFTDEEIDLFFNKFDIPKDKTITQEEMRQKLLQNFNMQTEADRLRGLEQEKDELGEKLMQRIRLLEDNITDVNYKIDLIDNKIDAIQQIRARRRTQQSQPGPSAE